MTRASHKPFFAHLEALEEEYRCIMVLNGTIPDRSFFVDLGKPVFAVDGAANKLMAEGVRPELVMGDLDGVDKGACPGLSFVHLPDQNYSDFEKSLDYLKKRDLLPAIIVGINGGYLDHIVNNINIFMRSGCLFYDPPIVGHVLTKGENLRIKLALQSKLSLIGMPSATVSTTGLKWNLDKAELVYPGQNSCFNRTESQNICLQVDEGALLALLYLEPIIDAGISNSR